MRVLHVCHENSRGGAGIGARRLHEAMMDYGLESTLAVLRQHDPSPGVVEFPKINEVALARNRESQDLNRLMTSDNPIIRSFNFADSGLGAWINEQDVDLVQLHWVGQNTLGTREIAAIKHPVFWKLPDMFPFSGAEHYPLYGDPPRHRDGFRKDNRPAHESGADLNRMAFLHKKWHWRRARFGIITPGRWHGRRVRESVLFGRYPHAQIFNPLNLDLYRPTDQKRATTSLGLAFRPDQITLVFGALDATKDARKGYPHLKKLLQRLSHHPRADQFRCVVFGGRERYEEQVGPITITHIGRILDEPSMVLAYNLADIFVFPAEMDCLPNAVKEASACGIVTLGFDTSGIPDMVDHRETGYLAPPFDIDDMLEGLIFLADADRAAMSKVTRERAETRHDPNRAVGNYLEFYRRTLKSWGLKRPEAD